MPGMYSLPELCITQSSIRPSTYVPIHTYVQSAIKDEDLLTDKQFCENFYHVINARVLSFTTCVSNLYHTF